MQIARLLEANAWYSAARARVSDARPSRQLAVLTCMDARIDVFAILGLHLGEAHVIRNAGGRVTDDVLRSLALSTHVLGVDTVVVMQHTKCGLVGVTDEALRASTGADVGFLPISDHDEDLREDIDLLIETPYLAPVSTFAGLVYDVETGEVTESLRWQRPPAHTDGGAAGDEPVVIDVESATTAVIGEIVAMDSLAPFFDRAFGVLPSTLERQGVGITGPAFALYRGQPGDTADIEVGFPTDRAVTREHEVHPSTLPGGRVVRLVHRGGYDGLGEAWMRLATWITDHGLTPGDRLWEVYTTEPTPDMDPATLETELNWLVS